MQNKGSLDSHTNTSMQTIRLSEDERRELRELERTGYELPAGWSYLPPDSLPRRHVDYFVDPVSVRIDLNEYVHDQKYNEISYRLEFPRAYRRTRVVRPGEPLRPDLDAITTWHEALLLARYHARGMSKRTARDSRVHKDNVHVLPFVSDAFVGFVYNSRNARDMDIRAATGLADQMEAPHVHFVDIDSLYAPMIGVFLPSKEMFGDRYTRVLSKPVHLGPLRVRQTERHIRPQAA